ncbi:MAG: NDP-sugar synthase [Actinobacteria bacterium]|nr:MAG: NDP-sugar synthase [Actinomycetota bacterium]
MKAVILVGGQGTRLRPLTNEIPKPMLPMANIPFFEHTLRLLKSYGITDIILSSGYLGDHFRDYFKDGSHLGVKLTHVIEDEPLGTCGAVKNVEGLFGKDTVAVLNGDILSSVNFEHLLLFHKERGAKVTLTLYSVEDPTAYGLVPLNGDGRVTEFVEKPSFDQVTTHWINAGIYLIEPEVLKYAPKGQNYSFERGLFPALLDKNIPIYGFPYSGYWKDIGSPQNYLKAHHDILEGRVTFDYHGQEVKPRVYIADGCNISDKANLFGPSIVGKNCSIDDNAFVFSCTTIGNNVKIAKSAKIYDSIIFDDVEIGENCIIKSSILARGVRLGDEVHIDNLSVLGDEVKVGHRNYLAKGIKLSPQSIIKEDQIRF